MTLVRIHYDGWLALPAAFRQALRLNTGDQLEAELVGGTIVLRPAPGMANSKGKEAIDSPRATKPTHRMRPVLPVATGVPSTKRVSAVLPPTLRSRGRRKGRGAAPAPQG
jgi:bifunctional DNA-binding transcriptional regulator/antitoxin component of YhaV-PrlF toxin-antitoxin module